MYDKFKSISTPVLIIGAGAAGARSAIEMARNGLEPLVISKRDHGDAHTTWARGGINAALGNLDPEDSWEIHAADTLDEGHFINNPEAVEMVTKNMPEVAEELHDWGMEFTETESGDINQRYFGAQSFRRTCFAGDYTGEALLDTLVEKAQELEIPYMDNIYITKILSDGNVAEGAIGYDAESGEFIIFNASKIVLAAGGHTSVYQRHSSRDDENTGDGVGLAFDAGAELVDMEFVQFHPTGMVGDKYGEEWDGRLVTEAVRGEGGRLYNSEGERFMKKYSPKQMELDARDVVARAITNEIEEGRGTENGGVFLDISHKDEEFIKERLPRMYERFDSLGVNISEEPMQVSPTAHYIMGGVKFNARTGETCVKDLHVLGETTAGVHGANRLGGNSLAETVSIGKVVGDYIGNLNVKSPQRLDEKFVNMAEKHRSERINMLERDEGFAPYELISEIRYIMENYAGIKRSESRLEEGLERIDDVEQNIRSMCVNGDVKSLEFEFANNALFMIKAAKATLKSAKKRKESRGAHYRTDYDEKSSEFLLNLVIESEEDGDMNIRDQEVGEPSEPVKKAIQQDHELDYHHLE
jgi:succinate dehydrogenase / fumarate reductase flavoprotein subunit